MNGEKTFKEFAEERNENSEMREIDREIEKPFFEPMSWTTLGNKKFPKRRWLVQGLIPCEGFVILASVTGEKKTWLAMEMARCIALGTDFLGQKEFKTEASNVLYVDMEMSQSEAQRRGRQLGFDESNKKILVYSDTELNLNTDEGVQWLINVIEYYEIKVAFLDTFRAVSGGIKEEKADEIRTFFNRLKVLKDKGVAVVFLDHFRKPSNFEGKVPKKEFLFGSTDKTASVEILLMLKSEPGGEEIDIYQRKNRLTKEIDPFKAIIKDQDGPDGVQTILSYGGAIEDQENKKLEAKERILEILPEGGRTKMELTEMLKKMVGSKNTQTALRELVKEGQIDMAKHGKENFYFMPKEPVESLVTNED
ncbi:MAG: AAA family ATPase [Patescibacteria group bacterium]